jgi:transposase
VNRAHLDTLVAEQGPKLTTLTGVGSVVAAAVLIAWSHPGRVRSEAAFAAIAGACPIPASSGNTVRHRLNRGGDRRLNRALHTIVLVRMRIDPATRAYVAKRRAQGRTTKEIMRSLKRYVARQLFRSLPTALDTT